MLNVAIDAIGTQATTSSASVAYTGLTVGSGSNRALMVAIGWVSDPGAITVARWDDGATNQNLTELVSIAASGGASWVGKVYGLRAPTTGNKTLQFTWTNSIEYCVNAMSFVNVDQTSDGAAFPTTATATMSGQNAAAPISIPSGGAAVSAGITGLIASVTNPFPVQLALVHGAGVVEFGYSYSMSPGLTIGFVPSVNDLWIVAAASVAPIYDTGGLPTATYAEDRIPSIQQRFA